jgi:hypothetical protein
MRTYNHGKYEQKLINKQYTFTAYLLYPVQPITVAALSKAWNVFARSNAGIAGSNPTQGMDVCLCLFCVCVGSGLSTGWSSVQWVVLTVSGLRNWSETKRFTNALCSKWEQQERGRERPSTWILFCRGKTKIVTEHIILWKRNIIVSKGETCIRFYLKGNHWRCNEIRNLLYVG